MSTDPVGPSPALTALRQRTREVHERLEAAANLASPDADRADYARHVAAMWGPDLSDAVLETLFEPFKRGSLDNPANPRGLGLGLYIASTIMREHGGALTVSSGGGQVTFTMVLPAAG